MNGFVKDIIFTLVTLSVSVGSYKRAVSDENIS